MPYWGNRVASLESKIAVLTAERDRLQAIVDQMLKTADGVIPLGDVVVYGLVDRSLRYSHWDKTKEPTVLPSVSIGVDGSVSLVDEWPGGEDDFYYADLSECYSTPEAAVAARERQ